MSNQDMEMQFADPDWQPASSRQGQSLSQLSLYAKDSHDGQTAPVQKKSQKGWPLFGLFSRVALVVLWFTTPLVNRAFHGGWILPLLGVLFLPFTALTYTVVFALTGGMTGLNWLWVVAALLVDLTSYGGQMIKRKNGSPRDGN